MVRLSLITFEERRETNLWVDIFVDLRKYGWDGVYKEQNEKWEDILKQRQNKDDLNYRRSPVIFDNSHQLKFWNGTDILTGVISR